REVAAQEARLPDGALPSPDARPAGEPAPGHHPLVPAPRSSIRVRELDHAPSGEVGAGTLRPEVRSGSEPHDRRGLHLPSSTETRNELRAGGTSTGAQGT